MERGPASSFAYTQKSETRGLSDDAEHLHHHQLPSTTKKVAYRAPAALCCWLFDVDIFPLILLCIASFFFKEASVQATSTFTFYYMLQMQL